MSKGKIDGNLCRCLCCGEEYGFSKIITRTRTHIYKYIIYVANFKLTNPGWPYIDI